MKSEKRFTLDDESRILDDGTPLGALYIVVMLNEQQATIRRLQDLCGESDGENAKLRIENKRLQKELNDCEKFRYTVFQRMRDVLDE